MSPSNKKIARALEGAPQLVIATVAIMEELASLLIREIDIVTKRRLTEHPALLKHKQKLAMIYRSNMKALSEQAVLMKNLSDDAKAAVRDVAQILSRAAADNARMLNASIQATQHLVQNIMAAIKTEYLPKNTYSNPAKAHLKLGVYSPTCKSVAISRSV